MSKRKRNGGYLYAKLHDANGEISPDGLSEDGLREGVFQARRLIDECNEELARREGREMEDYEYAA